MIALPGHQPGIMVKLLMFWLTGRIRRDLRMDLLHLGVEQISWI